MKSFIQHLKEQISLNESIRKHIIKKMDSDTRRTIKVGPKHTKHFATFLDIEKGHQVRGHEVHDGHVKTIHLHDSPYHKHIDDAIKHLHKVADEHEKMHAKPKPKAPK